MLRNERTEQALMTYPDPQITIILKELFKDCYRLHCIHLHGSFPRSDVCLPADREKTRKCCFIKRLAGCFYCDGEHPGATRAQPHAALGARCKLQLREDLKPL